MNMRTVMAYAIILVTAGVAWAQTAPKPLAPDFDILNKKSIFSRDRNTRDDNAPGGRNFRNRPAQAPRVYTPIFTGVMLEDDGYYVAFIGDPATGLLTTFRAGDALPMTAGTVKEITLDDMTVSLADHPSRKIAIGQNILGGNAEYPAPPAPEVASTTAPDGGGTDGSSPASPTAASMTPGAGATARLPGETMFDYFRRRRAQQVK